MSDVVISYSHRGRDFAAKVRFHIEEHNRVPWIDKDGIPPAANFTENIDREIERSQAVVFVLSPSFLESDFCRKEISHAVRSNKKLIPILLSAVNE